MTNRQLRDFYKITQSTLARLKQKGINVFNPYAVRDKLLGQCRRPDAWTNGCVFTDEEAEAFMAGGNGRSRGDNITLKTTAETIAADEETSLREKARNATTYDQARFYLTQIKALKEDLQLQILEGEYMSKKDVQADFLRMGYALRAGMTRMSSELAPAIAGLDEVSVSKKVREATQNTLRMMGDQASELYDGAPPASEV